jgi:hypothetical protein
VVLCSHKTYIFIEKQKKQGKIMSEKAPEGPKPGPGLHKVESQDETIARLEAELAKPAVVAEQPSAEPAFTFVDKRNAASQAWSKEMKDEDAQAKLDAQLNAVEATNVAETPFVEEVVSVPAPAVTEAAVAPATTAEVTTVEASDVPTVEEVATPTRGKLTHHDYHTQRPADGSVYRTNKNFQRAAGGTEPVGIAKNGREEYDKQIGVNDPNRANKHYDEVNGLNEAQPATPERPSYETMDTDQLIFAYAKAEMIGDKHVTDDIRNVYTTAMEEAYTKPGSPITYEEHQEALDRFDRLTDAAIEYEKAKDPEHSALVDAAVERANKEPSIGDKLKKWWGKNKESIKNVFKPTYWAERWTNAIAPKIGETASKILNLGINEETDSDEEKDRKRKRNRVIFIAGGASVAVAAIATSYGVGFAVGSGGHHAAEAANAGIGSGHGGAGGNTLSAHDQAVANALTPHRAPAISEQLDQHRQMADIAQNAANAPAIEAPNVNDPGFNISNGEGGLELFSSLNIDPSKWAAHANDLVTKFPQDFYNMPGGGVGISHQGQLSLEARNAIEALR